MNETLEDLVLEYKAIQARIEDLENRESMYLSVFEHSKKMYYSIGADLEDARDVLDDLRERIVDKLIEEEEGEE